MKGHAHMLPDRRGASTGHVPSSITALFLLPAGGDKRTPMPNLIKKHMNMFQERDGMGRQIEVTMKMTAGDKNRGAALSQVHVART